jgi:hypothetical protein
MRCLSKKLEHCRFFLPDTLSDHDELAARSGAVVNLRAFWKDRPHTMVDPSQPQVMIDPA